MILAGDFNARIGLKDAALYRYFSKYPPETEVAHSIPERQSKDKGCNHSRLYFLGMIKDLDLVLLNWGHRGR